MRNHPSELKSLHFLWGGIAFVVYFALIGLLLIYFNQRNVEKPKHFVKKDEKRIQVRDAEPIQSIKIKTIVEKPKPKKISKKKDVVKPIKPKIIPKKDKAIIKEKIVKRKVVKKKVIKKQDENLTKPKKKKLLKVKKIEKPKKPSVKKTSDLFSSVKTTKKEVKNKIKVIDKPKSANEKINSNKKGDRGIEHAYFAKVQSLLETWPAQSDYAGEKAIVTIYVKPTGMFEFKVKSQSDNIDFNLGLIDFLMQLQRMGLGKHDAGKTYEFQVEFIAKE